MSKMSIYERTTLIIAVVMMLLALFNNVSALDVSQQHQDIINEIQSTNDKLEMIIDHLD